MEKKANNNNPLGWDDPLPEIMNRRWRHWRDILPSAVLTTQVIRMIRKELDVEVNKEIYYSDSKVVLGYIQNESRRFYIYLANRVPTICNATNSHQWRYIDTANNPADLATRCMSPDKLMELHWLLGPEFLWNALPQPHDIPQKIVLNENEPEVK